MALDPVAPTSTDIKHLASVDVKFSGVHIGGGIYFSANHFPSPGGTSVAIPQRFLAGEAESHGTTEIDYTLPDGGDPWDSYRDDLDGNGAVDAVKAGFDMSLHVGSTLSGTGAFYDGPAASLLIANDQADLSGTITVTGYPTGTTELIESAGTLASGDYVEQDIGGDIGGYHVFFGAEAIGGMSGGPGYLEFDANDDGTTETYLLGTTSRAGTVNDPVTGDFVDFVIFSTSFAPHYAELAAELEGLTGAAARTADDFARMAMLSAQTVGSSLTSVQGTFFHEDIYGGINADTLLGADGDDYLEGRAGGDSINGGDGTDTIDGGTGGDTLSGGAGADLFEGTGFGGGATDIVADFNDTEDVIDLSAHFATLDDVIAAATEPGDGSTLVAMPAGSGGGTLQILSTSISDLTVVNVNVICFTEGTQILTEAGERAIETLCSGTKVVSYDGSVKTLRAVNARSLGKNELRTRPNLWPVHIMKGALGDGIPANDLRISPQHRILINSKIAQRMTGGETLVAAKKLLDLPGVHQPVPSGACTFLHLVFDRHEIVRAEGCWSESLFPGDQALLSLQRGIAQEYLQIFADRIEPARPFLKARLVPRLLQRHSKNRKALQITMT